MNITFIDWLKFTSTLSNEDWELLYIVAIITEKTMEIR